MSPNQHSPAEVVHNNATYWYIHRLTLTMRFLYSPAFGPPHPILVNITCYTNLLTYLPSSWRQRLKIRQTYRSPLLQFSYSVLHVHELQTCHVMCRALKTNGQATRWTRSHSLTVLNSSLDQHSIFL